MKVMTLIKPFNSLSRDHSIDYKIEEYAPELPTFNSLSRDHFAIKAENIAKWLGLTFNSLSRDHMSTLTKFNQVEPFNSLSRDHSLVVSDEGIVGLIFAFQLPLSGSPVRNKNVPHPRLLAFNSLSRDHRTLFRDLPALRGFPPRRPFAHLYFPATI